MNPSFKAGSLVRPQSWVKGDYKGKVGIIVHFNSMGYINSTDGDPVVLWSGESEPRLMSELTIEPVS